MLSHYHLSYVTGDENANMQFTAQAITHSRTMSTKGNEPLQVYKQVILTNDFLFFISRLLITLLQQINTRARLSIGNKKYV